MGTTLARFFVNSIHVYPNGFFKIIFPECANTEQFRTVGPRIKIGFDFYQLTEESNPGRQGEKRERYLYAMPSPHVDPTS